MCLALYGNCPRLSGDGTRETVQDIDGQALRSNDPRMALRRGGARGLAEVTFRTTDGEIYVAGWQARRARGKIDGRLQSIERSLLRASDNQMLETQLTAVNEKVVELTGLTYDEFRRTVLLAQGDFAAFLEGQNRRACSDPREGDRDGDLPRNLPEDLRLPPTGRGGAANPPDTSWRASPSDRRGA